MCDALMYSVRILFIGGSLPVRAAAMLPAILPVLPGLDPGLALARDRVGAPELLAGIEVGAVNESPDAELAAGRPDDCHVPDDQGRERERLADIGVCDF